MWRRAWAFIGFTAAFAAGVPLAASAHADTDNPCDLAMSFLCRFVPMAPELEGDIDLSTQLPAVDPAGPVGELLPPVDFCAAGCV